MHLLFTGGLNVHNGQVYIESGWEILSDPLSTAFAGQVYPPGPPRQTFLSAQARLERVG